MSLRAKDKTHRRVTFGTRRHGKGWLPIVLIGEEPIMLSWREDKRAAKEAARDLAAHLRSAGQG